MSPEDKNLIEKLYDSLSNLSIKSLGLEISFDEKKEAEMINVAFKRWNESKENFMKIIKGIENPEKQTSYKKEKSYFG
jgi:hypothetical protein